MEDFNLIYFQELIKLAQMKKEQEQLTYKTTPRSSFTNCNSENQTQRNSLPGNLNHIFSK